MTISIIIFCILGFIITSIYSKISKDFKIIKQTSLGIVSNVIMKKELKNEKASHLYDITINDIVYKINTVNDFGHVIRAGTTAKLLTMQSGKKFLNFNNDNKLFYIYNYKDLDK